MQNFYNRDYRDIDECTSRGSCSVSPTIASLEVLSMKFLKHLAYYLLKLEDFGANNEKIKIEVLNILASLVSVNEFNDVQLHSIIMNEYFMLEEARKTYLNLCKINEIRPKDLQKISHFSSETTLSQAISIGERLFFDSLKHTTVEERNMTEILNIVIKSLCLNLIMLKNFEVFNDTVYHEILETLNIFNSARLKISQISKKIDVLITCNMNLQFEIANLLTQTFGGISKMPVSHSSRHGKAILVSGNNFFDLLRVLETTINKGIDVYTHSNLLITHALAKFHNFNHLIGHYGDTTENSILDFATFPGAILLTQNFHSNNEYLYRGRLFSNDYIVPKGVSKIENEDYSVLIDAAMSTKGFSKGKTKQETTIGYNLSEVQAKFTDIIAKLKSKKYERLYIIGINTHSEIQKAYFKEFFSNLKRNEFVISFSYESAKENVYTINVGNYTPLVTNLLKIFFENYDIKSDNIVFFCTTCDVMSLSGIIMLKNLGAKNVYMAECSPILLNPSVFNTFKDKYSIETISTVSKDLDIIRKK